MSRPSCFITIPVGPPLTRSAADRGWRVCRARRRGRAHRLREDPSPPARLAAAPADRRRASPPRECARGRQGCAASRAQQSQRNVPGSATGPVAGRSASGTPRGQERWARASARTPSHQQVCQLCVVRHARAAPGLYIRAPRNEAVFPRLPRIPICRHCCPLRISGGYS